MRTIGTNKAIADLLEPYSPETQKLALATRALVFKVIPKTIGWATELPDPQKLLEGTGKVHRHVKLQSWSDLDDPALKALLKAGIAHWKTVRKAKPAKIKTSKAKS